MKRLPLRFSILTLLITTALIAVGVRAWHRYAMFPKAQRAYQRVCRGVPLQDEIDLVKPYLWEFPELAHERDAIHGAAKIGDVQWFRYVHKQGARLDALSVNGKKSPLFEAIYYNRCDIVAYLRDAGMDVTSWNGTGEEIGTPLQTAALAGHLEMCRLLVAEGADVNQVVDEGSSPLHSAIRSGKADVVKFLLDQGAVYPRQSQSPIAVQIRDMYPIRFAFFPPTREPVPQDEMDEIIRLLEEKLPELAEPASESDSP